MLGSAMLGTLGYTLLTYGRLLEISPHKREKYWNERMKMDEMVKSGIMRSSYSSVIPAIMDTGAFMTTGEAMFSGHMRTTDQAVGLEGTVPYGLYKQITSQGGEIGEALRKIITGHDHPMSKRDLRDLTRILWITQVPGINEITDYLISESSLDETDQRKY